MQARLRALPPKVKGMAGLDLQKVLDYQDLAYGSDYLDTVEQIRARDQASWDMTVAAATYGARALCCDDLLRVADLKTRAARFSPFRTEIGAKDGQVLQLREHSTHGSRSSPPPCRAGWAAGCKAEGASRRFIPNIWTRAAEFAPAASADFWRCLRCPPCCAIRPRPAISATGLPPRCGWPIPA